MPASWHEAILSSLLTIPPSHPIPSDIDTHAKAGVGVIATHS